MTANQVSASKRRSVVSASSGEQFRPRTRTRTRTYRLDICTPPLDDLAWDVIHSIERTDIHVADPNDAGCLGEKHDENGAILLDSDATLSVPIADWLAVGCQRIRWHHPEGDEPFRDGVCGVYRSNWLTVLGAPYAEAEPHGPAVFVGEIILPSSIQRAWWECREDGTKRTGIEQAFQLVIAHELVHVFDTLKYLVPAFMNWRKFWRDVLGEGSANDLLLSRANMKDRFVDDYGGENELAMIEEWWPSRAETWWEARRLFSLFAGADGK